MKGSGNTNKYGEKAKIEIILNLLSQSLKFVAISKVRKVLFSLKTYNG
jgi:hypothetical protein